MLNSELVDRTKNEGKWRGAGLARGASVLTCLVSIWYYVYVLQWRLPELLRTGVGIVALWLPIGSLCYTLLRREAPDRYVRLAFSAIGSYCLTTLVYFLFCMVHASGVFYVAQAILLVSVALHAWRSRDKSKGNLRDRLRLPRIDWTLAALISLSLVANIKYQRVFDVTPETGYRLFVLAPDQSYFVSQAYELSRHVPPVQQVNQAGLPERAYHMFPHLTTVLISRFTGQSDMLRAHLVYHYAVLAILMNLVLFALVKTIARSRWAGYLGASLMYVLTCATPRLLQGAPIIFYFALYPHISSALDPVLLTSPQMYSGVICMYGIMLGILLVSRRHYRGKSTNRLFILVALMVGAMIRFRIQAFLPLFPGFFLLAGYLWWKSRRVIYLWGAFAAAAAAVLLFVEMKSPGYLENTTKLFIGYNHLTWRRINEDPSFINRWPLSDQVFRLLNDVISDTSLLNWIWQIVSVTAFVLLNMAGIPMILAAVIFLKSRLSGPGVRIFTLALGWMVAGSILGAILLTTNYDPFSVGGQMLFHTCWYLFPILGVSLWLVCRRIQARGRRVSPVLIVIWILAIAASLLDQLFGGMTILESAVRSGVGISADEWTALQFIHDRTPQNSVIISSKPIEPAFVNFAMFGALAGRASYFEFPQSAIVTLPSKTEPVQNRAKIIKDLWAETAPERFCNLLYATGATHLVEYGANPLKVEHPPCLRKKWVSSGQSEKITIWRVVPR